MISESQEALILQEECRLVAGQLYSCAVQLEKETNNNSAKANRKSYEAEHFCFLGLTNHSFLKNKIVIIY